MLILVHNDTSKLSTFAQHIMLEFIVTIRATAQRLLIIYFTAYTQAFCLHFILSFSTNVGYVLY